MRIVIFFPYMQYFFFFILLTLKKYFFPHFSEVPSAAFLHNNLHLLAKVYLILSFVLWAETLFLLYKNFSRIGETFCNLPFSLIIPDSES